VAVHLARLPPWATWPAEPPRGPPPARQSPLLLETFEDRTVPNFAAAINYAAGNEPLAVVTGDGKLDLAKINNQDNTVSVLLNKSDGTFQAAQTSGTGTGPIFVAAGDLNKDGKLDLVTASLGGDLSVLLGNGEGTFAPATSVSLPDAAGLMQAPHADNMLTDNLGKEFYDLEHHTTGLCRCAVSCRRLHGQRPASG
jgi:hypothetical protein